MRIIADHIKAAAFIINDGITPSNSEQGYVLRRLIRRAINHARSLNLENFTTKLIEPICKIYDDYKLDKKLITTELQKEEEKFAKTIHLGLRTFEKISERSKEIDGKTAFLLYQSYGFPIEMTEEIAKEKNLKLDLKGFHKAQSTHQELSRTAAKGKFAGGLADASVETTKLHTAAHLLNEALRKVLGENVMQKGANINAERLRFDFGFTRKLTEEEVKKVEDLINKIIKEGLDVTFKEMTLAEAKKIGAYGVFESKYKEKDKIKVYTIGKFSTEICGGPHVKNTKDMGTFKITKQESCGAGVRRVKATLS
jgi:alanyl-tRNA synthetase